MRSRRYRSRQKPPCTQDDDAAGPGAIGEHEVGDLLGVGPVRRE